MAAWVWDTGPMRERAGPAGLPGRPGHLPGGGRGVAAGAGRAGRAVGERDLVLGGRRRQGIYDIRQLLQLADSLKAPRLALLPVILGQPDALSDLLPGPAALPAGGAQAMADQQTAELPGAATGAAARALAARLGAHGYQVSFPPGRDPAVFKVTGLPGRPDVEVSAENDGSAACHYTGCTPAQAAKVIARPAGPRPLPGPARRRDGDRDLGRHRSRMALPAPARAARRPCPDDGCPARPPGRPRRQSRPEGRPGVNTTCLAGRTVPGELLRLVADGLAGAGLDVRPPADADGCRLDIALPGARCTLAVGEGGSAEWEYWPWSADDADPGLTADLATVLLTGRAGPQPRLASGHQPGEHHVQGHRRPGAEGPGPGCGAGGLLRRDRLRRLRRDRRDRSRAGDDGGQVCVADDGGLTWTRDYLADAAALPGRAPVRPLTRPASPAWWWRRSRGRWRCLRPAGAGRASHG